MNTFWNQQQQHTLINGLSLSQISVLCVLGTFMYTLYMHTAFYSRYLNDYYLYVLYGTPIAGDAKVYNAHTTCEYKSMLIEVHTSSVPFFIFTYR